MTGNARTMWWETPLWYWIDGKPVDAQSIGLLSMNTDAMRVAVTTLRTPESLIAVSTVFTGIDYNWQRYVCAVLWETMVFNGPIRDQRRYAAFSEAQAGHSEIVGELVDNLGHCGVDIIERVDQGCVAAHVERVIYADLDKSQNYHPAMSMPLHPEAERILATIPPDQLERMRSGGTRYGE